jgi:hypothetical protein
VSSLLSAGHSLANYRVVPTTRDDRAATRIETLIGRGVAVCAHPSAAWRLEHRQTRLLLVGGYFVIGFVGVLTALTFLSLTFLL